MSRQVHTLEEFEQAEERGERGIWFRPPCSGDMLKEPGVWILCPGCGQRSYLPINSPVRPTWHIICEEPLTLQPNIYHQAEECGWHGYLRHGEFASL